MKVWIFIVVIFIINVACNNNKSDATGSSKSVVDSNSDSNSNSSPSNNSPGIVSINSQIDSLVNEGELNELAHTNFSSGGFEDVAICSGNCPSVEVDENNDYYLQADLCGSFNNTYRTELSFSDVYLKQDHIYIYHLKVRFHTDPSENPLPHKSMFMQVHIRKENDPEEMPHWQTMTGRIESNGISGLFQSESVLPFPETDWTEDYDNGDDVREFFNTEENQWQDIIVVHRLSQTSLGQTTVYVNKSKKFEILGTNMGDWSGDFYPKLGIYASKNKVNRPDDFSLGCRRTDFKLASYYEVLDPEFDTSGNFDVNSILNF